MTREFTAADRAVLRMLTADPHLEVSDAEFLSQGWTNRNFRVRVGALDRVLRICPPADTARTARRRWELATLAGPARGIAPALLGYALPDGHLLTEFVPGPLLADADPDPEALGAFVARVHAALPPFGRNYDPARRIEAHLARARAAGARPDPAVRAALTMLDTNVAASAGCHNDFNPWNVIVHPEGWVLVDWETAADNHPLYDLVSLFEGLAWPEAKRRTALGCYCLALGHPPHDDAEMRAITRLFQLGEYAWAFAERAAGNERDELETQIATSLGALKALA